uniref:Uncharacterized protein n=1 Tax=Buteo japonicus TaxID=224669 RepID=A0A8C0BIR6_9AVES
HMDCGKQELVSSSNYIIISKGSIGGKQNITLQLMLSCSLYQDVLLSAIIHRTTYLEQVLLGTINESRHNSTVEEDSEGDNDSEEFYYGGQVSYDGELHKHPQLEADLTAVREIYGPNAVSLREYGAIDDVDIDLHIDVSFLDEEIAVAWDVIRTEPIIVRLHCSLTQYLNGPGYHVLGDRYSFTIQSMTLHVLRFTAESSPTAYIYVHG